MGAKAVDDVRRGSGQWRMAVRPRACARRPRVTDLGVGGSSCSQSHSARGGSPRTGGHWPAPACVPGGTAAGHAHGATSCARARVCKNSSTYPFPIEFSPYFKMKVTQTLNNEVVQQVTIFKNAKGCVGFFSRV
jgi:hypothetical protein